MSPRLKPTLADDEAVGEGGATGNLVQGRLTKRNVCIVMLFIGDQMKSSPCLLALATGLIFSSLVSRADTLTAFALSGTVQYKSNYTSLITGTMTVDTTTGIVVSFTLPNLPPDYSLEYVGQDMILGDVEAYGSFGNNRAGYPVYSLDLTLPVNSLVGYMGGAICSELNACAAGNSEYGFGPGGGEFADGTLTDLGTVPEPSSFLLLGTGLLSVAGAIRKRLL